MRGTLEAYRLLMADVYELAGTSRRTSEELAREAGQTAARWHVLSVVSDGPRTVPSAARRLGLAPQSVQRVVDDLIRLGQVETLPNPDHVRSPLVSLTDAGRGTLERLFAGSERTRTELLNRAGVTATQLARAREVLQALIRAFESAGASRDQAPNLNRRPRDR